MSRISVALLILLVVGFPDEARSQSHRWPPNQPILLETNLAPAEAIRRVRKMCRGAGYSLIEEDERDGFLRVKAQESGGIWNAGIFRTENSFSIQVDDDGRVRLQALGGLVRNGGTVMHHALKSEFDRFADLVRSELGEPAPPE